MTDEEFTETLKADFRNFLWHIWQHIMLPDPTPIQYDVAEYLQDGPERMIIEGFRGMGKSFITSAFCCWLWLRDPELKIMVVSGSKDRADAFAIFTKKLLGEVPVLMHLDPMRGTGRQRNDVFDLCGVASDSLWRELQFAGRLLFKRLDENEWVHRRQASDVNIETPDVPVQVDGDVIGTTPMHFTIDHRALKISIPSGELPPIFSQPASG